MGYLIERLVWHGFWILTAFTQFYRNKQSKKH